MNTSSAAGFGGGRDLLTMTTTKPLGCILYLDNGWLSSSIFPANKFRNIHVENWNLCTGAKKEAPGEI